MNGVLVIDKPSGPTSFDVVRRVRALLGVRKVGHTGTLDPLATGVLPVCVGQATRIAGFITEGNKAYEAIVRLGVETDTLDAAGAEVSSAPVPPLDAARLEAVLSRFRGTFPQTPPMYSAVKVRGRRLYELAQAVPLERLESGDLAEVEARLVSLSDALSELPALRVSESDASRVGHGVP